MTPNKENIEAILCAYVDGDLDEAGRAEIEKHLTENPQHRHILAEMIAMRDWVKDLPRAMAPSELADALTGQLERSVLLGQGPAISQAIPSAVNRRSQWLAVAAVVFLTAGLGLAVWVILIPTSGRPKFAQAPVNSNSDTDHDIVLAQPPAPTDQPAPSSAAGVAAPDAPVANSPAPAPAGAASAEMPVAAGPSAPILAENTLGSTTQPQTPEGVASASNGNSNSIMTINGGTLYAGGTLINGGSLAVPSTLPVSLADSADQPPAAVRDRLALAGVSDSTESGRRMVVLVNAADPSAASAQVAQVLSSQNIAYSNRVGPNPESQLAFDSATLPNQQLAMDRATSPQANGDVSVMRDSSLAQNQRMLVASNAAPMANQINAQASAGAFTQAPEAAAPQPGAATMNSPSQQQMVATQAPAGAPRDTVSDRFTGDAEMPAPSAAAAPAAPAAPAPSVDNSSGVVAGADGPTGEADGFGVVAGGGFGADRISRGGRGGGGGGAAGAPALRARAGAMARSGISARTTVGSLRPDNAPATMPTNAGPMRARPSDFNSGVFIVRNLTAGQAHNLQTSLASSGGLDLHVYGPHPTPLSSHAVATPQPSTDESPSFFQQNRRFAMARPATNPSAADTADSAPSAKDLNTTTRPAEPSDDQSQSIQQALKDNGAIRQTEEKAATEAINNPTTNVAVTVSSDQVAAATEPSDADGLLVLIVVQSTPATQPVAAPAGQ